MVCRGGCGGKIKTASNWLKILQAVAYEHAVISTREFRVFQSDVKFIFERYFRLQYPTTVDSKTKMAHVSRLRSCLNLAIKRVTRQSASGTFPHGGGLGRAEPPPPSVDPLSAWLWRRRRRWAETKNCFDAAENWTGNSLGIGANRYLAILCVSKLVWV